MELEIIILSELSQKKVNTIWYHLYLESKIGHKWTYLRNRNRLTDTDQICGCWGGGSRKRDGLEIWGWWIQTITCRMDKQQGPIAQGTISNLLG